MSLLQKASIVTTPTAYGVGVLNSIKPAFSLSADLVSNGNFSNGSTGWGLGSNWTIADGKASCDGSASNSMSQASTVGIASKTFKVSYDVLSISQGSIRITLGGVAGASVTQVGSYSDFITATSTDRLRIFADSNAIASVDNIVVEQLINADFDFTRTSSATRVNPDYLIETVSINSANLVQNGNFSELGSQLVTNGDFATDSNWIKGTGWTISGGKAICDGSQTGNTGLQQSGVAVSGKIYKIQFDLTVDAGFINYVNLGGWIDNTNLTTSNTYTYYTTTTTNTDNLGIAGDSNFVGSVDNVSVKQVDPNDNWTLGTGWSLGTDKAICDGSQSSQSNLYQANIVPINKTYKVTFTIVVNAGSMVLAIGGSNAQPTVSSSGTYTFTSKATSGDSNLYFSASSDFIGSITNISVIEIQENGVPRLDYTNGTASILLEPQSTNLITYSQDFSQWTKTGTTSVSSNDNISPDGTLNASTVSGLTGSGSNDLRLDIGLNTSNKTYTFSVYLKGSGTLRLHLSNNIDNAASNVVTLTTSWVRYELTHTFNSTTSTSLSSVLDDSGGTATEYNVWGAMLEEKSFATSYIPTSGQSGGVTRAAESLNNAGSSDLINSTEGVLYIETKLLTPLVPSNNWITISDGTASNVVALVFETTGTTVGRIDVGGSNQAFFSITGDYSLNQKIAFKWKENDFAFWINGVEVGTDNVGSVPNANTLNNLKFNYPPGGNNFHGNTKCVAVFKEALTDTELACLTSTNNREIFLNYYYRMQYVGANTEALSCAEQTFNV